MGSGTGASRSRSETQILPAHEQAWKYYGTDVLPMARGEDTAYTRRLAQTGADAAKKGVAIGQQNLMQVAGQTGMTGPEVLSYQKGLEETGVQAMVKNILAARQQASLQAMQMIAGVPMQGQKQQSSTKATRSYVFGLYSG